MTSTTPRHAVAGLAAAMLLAGLNALAAAQTPVPNAGAQKQLEQMMRDPQLQQMMNQAASQARPQAAAPPPAAPARDPARLAAVSRTPVSAEALRQHVASVQAALLQRLAAPQRDATQRLIAALRGQPGEPARSASQAWLMGRLELGLVLMGQACVEHPGDLDALNNFAAFLTMLGGEAQAMPILLRLAADYPNNSTVQNNLGQAWFGLGDRAEAAKHLKTAVRLYPAHSQANQTLADIDEATGDPASAVTELKQALQASYSGEKLARLKRLGAAPDPLSIPLHLPRPPDPLGLEKFTLPPVCKGLDDAEACSARWNAFRTELDAHSEPLKARIEALKKELQKRLTPTGANRIDEKSTLAQKMAAAQQIVANTGMDHPPPLQPLVQARFHEALDRVARLNALLDKDVGPLQEQFRSSKASYGARLGAIEKRYGPLWGAGQPPGLEQQHCDEVNALFDDESRSLNPLLERIAQMGRERVQRALNDEVFYGQYYDDDLNFELLKTQAKLQFLSWLGSQQADPAGPRCGPPKKAQTASVHLQDFYDLHCDHLIRFDTKFGDFEVKCNKMIAHVKFSVPIGGLTLGVHGTREDNLDADRFVRATAGVDVSGGRKVSAGPVDIGVGASAGGYVEMDGQGITDVGATGSVSAGAGPIGASTEGRVGWNAGASGSAKGTLGGFTVAGH